jgi:hypothetical protein
MFVFVATLVSSLFCRAQDAASMTPNELVAAAIDHLKNVQKESQNYANTSDFESDYYDVQGKRISRFTSHTEDVALNGEPYERAAIVNGKRLSEEELETARKNLKTTLAERHDKVDAGLIHGSLSFLLTAAYQNRVVGHESVEGRDCIVLESTPAIPITNPLGQLGYRFWIDAENFNVLRSRSQTLADYDPGLLSSGRVSTVISLKGSTYTTTYRLFKGVLLPYEDEGDFFSRTKQGNRFGHTHSILTYSDYQRYKVTVTIGPAAIVPMPTLPQP